MIATSSLSMAFGKKVLFENVSLKFTPGNCYGLIGANGTGKSTFLKILTGELEQTTGQVFLEPGKRMGWLKQDISGSDDVRVLDLVMMGHPVIWKLQAEMAALTAKADFTDADGARLGELQEKFQELDGYSQESNAAEVLTDLGVPPEVHDKNLGDIDSALKVRVLLTQALFSKPDVLLLDEPTNNLDIPAMVWLEKFLADYEGVIVVVSHDRHFLNRVCNLTCDVDYKTIRIFNGSYDVYQAQEQLARAQRSKEVGRIERQVEKLKLFVERFKSNAARSKQATSREKQIAQLSGQKVVPSSRVAPRLFFKLPKPSGQDVIKVENISFAHAGAPNLISKFSTRIDRGDRLGIVGRNGIGKTTLIRLLLGELEPSAGKLTWGLTTSRAYFPQEGSGLFTNKDLSIVDWIKQYTDNQDINNMRSMLGRMLFSGDDVKKQVGVLSGGEKVRCLLSMVMLQEANVLVLDEPTSHLDMESIEALQEALEEYQGTLIFVSHDREFIDAIGNRTIVMEDGDDGMPKLTDWKGNYREFRLARELE
ncbi:MAG: ATP-binding cassette domain-containing protein [Planctomycetes bacterium]|nr:ATP-binding cassette domain-containing protein [Planctomycetota bacterium]